MTDRIALRCRPGEIEIGAWVADRLVDYALWRPGAPDGLGDVHCGRVTARVTALGGCFVRLAAEADGFLPEAFPAVGDAVVVRITRAAHGTKGPRLALVDEAAREFGLVRRGPSPLDEMMALHSGLAVEVADPGVAADLAGVHGPRLRRVDRVAFEAGDLFEKDASLPGGARASIWPTPALVAIDVDTAAATAGHGAKQVAQFAANRALLPPLLHQLRLRNLSGAILVDLAGLAARKRARLAVDFTAALALDPLRPRFLGFTSLGLAEIVRVRRRPALHELSASPYTRALAAADALARRQREDPHDAFGLRASPELARMLAEDTVIGRDLARASGRSLMVRPDASLAAGSWIIEERTA